LETGKISGTTGSIKTITNKMAVLILSQNNNKVDKCGSSFFSKMKALQK